MIRKIQKVELQASANVVTKGDEIVLTANLSDTEMEIIKEQRGHLKYMVGSQAAKMSTSDPRSASWTPDSTDPGEYLATLALVINDKPLTIGETKIHVLAPRSQRGQ